MYMEHPARILSLITYNANEYGSLEIQTDGIPMSQRKIRLQKDREVIMYRPITYRFAAPVALLFTLLLAACAPVAAPAGPAEATAAGTPEAAEPEDTESTEPESAEIEGEEIEGEEAQDEATEVTTTETTTSAAAASSTTASATALLRWEGEIDGACYTLAIEPDGAAEVGLCGDQASSTADLSQNNEWAAIQEHFGSIDAETPAGHITFTGQGSAQNSLWAQALATWASFTAMETNAGRAGASARTTLAWQLTTTPEHSGLCSQLIVLAYGYAYANQIPCDGNGQSTQVAAGWLADTELDTFFEWVNNGARVESELGYLDARGETPITPEEVTNWANAVYTRLLQ